MLHHYAFSLQHRAQFSEDVYVFILWRYVTLQICPIRELFVPGIDESTLNIKIYFYITTKHHKI